ncbi:MAG TPA: FAD-dependent oxidoreductase [Burkholderiales bacterium]|nr:FAD-dependent oxidoreductase [Burkholderiales bacterium]
MTRRELIVRAAQAGGYGAALVLMRSMDLVADPAQGITTRFRIPSNAGQGTKVAIIGAGIAGLVAAYEMRRSGFDCTVLEARQRPGGRNWTVRRSDKVEFLDGTVQTCAFDAGQYFNAGAARIPAVHRTILGYCRELGVPMEVLVNTSRGTLLQSDHAFGSKPIEQRQAINDTRGHVAELLAKAIRRGALDQEVTLEDRERMLAFLQTYGDLSAEFLYKGSSRAGAAQLPGAAGQEMVGRDPLPLNALLDASFWQGILFEEGLERQATLLQPVGGMDRIPYAFAQKLGQIVKYGCPVREIRKTVSGVRVSYDERGATRSIDAAYCISTLPLSVLRTIKHDLSSRVAAAMNQVEYASGYKIAWESRRFWEQDDNIYGGISWLSTGPISLASTGGLLANVWYPSNGFLADKGVLIAGYGTETGEFGALLSMADKLAASRAAVEKLHPGRGKELTKPLYVAWAKIPFSAGSWVRSAPDYYDGPYREFLVPDDRIYFAGDYCSHLPSWQEGAALSAQRTVQLIVERVRQS